MNYRCPKCSHKLKVRTLFFHDISTCAHCGLKVVLGDVLAFFMAALTMLVAALTSLYYFSNAVREYFVAAGYAEAIGMLSGILVLLAARARHAVQAHARAVGHAVRDGAGADLQGLKA